MISANFPIPERPLAVFVLFACLVCVPSMAEGQVEGPPAGRRADLVYLWYPRSADIPANRYSPDAIILRALLSLATTERYMVVPGDNLDYIIRRRFFVSEKQKNAYSLYVRRIRSLNPTLDSLGMVKPGLVLLIPAGPQYGATEIGQEKLAPNIAKQTFLRMSANAYFGSAHRQKVYTDALTDKVVRSLGYLVATNATQLSTMEPSKILAKVQERGIVPPINLNEHPESQLSQAQPMHLLAGDSQRDHDLVSELIATETHGRLLPGSLPEGKNVVVNCPHCTACPTLLKLPTNIDLSRARLLVEDTGIDPQVLKSPNNLIYVPDGTDGKDVSPDHHGTFVFSEVARSGQGPIPDNQVFVAKVASITQGGVGFEVDDIIKAWKKFSNTMKSSGVKANTWVVNLSAEGEPPPDTQPPPLLLHDPNLLIVAAAGNGASGRAPATEAFDRLSNGNSNLLIVGALSQTGDLATYSNYHPSNVQILATGDCTCGAPGQLNGTSQAAPLVAVAAAALASERPEWYASEVMWRLIATADRPDELRNMSLSGPVNLISALRRGIILRIANGLLNGTNELEGTQIQFDQEWTNSIQTSGAGIDKGFVLLRLFDPTSSGGNVCFSPLRWQLFGGKSVCVSAGAQVTLTIGQSTQSFVAAKIKDIILPMDTDRIDALPIISAKDGK